MKKIIFEELIRNLKKRPHLYKKIKIFAIVGVFVFMALSALTVYFGVVGVRYVASLANEVNVTGQVEVLKEKVNRLPAISKESCLTTVQGLLSLDPLLREPIVENFQKLKTACFDQGESKELTEEKESVPI